MPKYKIGRNADGMAVTNTWTADALLLREARPDGGWTENVYDANRRRVGQMSSDPSCEYGLFLDSFGRTVAASNSVVRYAYSLANCGVATNEAASVGLESIGVARGVDQYGRVVSISRDDVEDAVVYSPTNGTIAAISNAEAYVTYAYTSDLLDAGCELTLADGMRFSRDVRRNSLYSRENVHAVTNCAASATNEFRYAFDALNRPVSRNSDAFAYNRRGEVASALVGGLSATYAYDGIGNATASVWNDATTTYSANALNQYELAAKPGDSAWMHYLENGELAYDGRRNYFYDAKSRLVAVGEWVFDEDRYHYDDYDDYDELWSFDLAVSNRYDHLDRRVQKVTPAATHTYFYDGWMLIKETVANTNGTTDVIEYHWGKDLSGTIGGAGGVGGLLYLKRNGAIYVPWYDAYGNVMGYWDAQGNVVAEYTYDAFGKLISSSGPMADIFAIRYSTKYFDIETGLYYYGYRFYSPELMRWITRDPIEEEGGVNLYAMCGNNSINSFDTFGLKRWVLIYYSRADQQSFRLAALTMQRKIERSPSFDPKCDKVLLHGALTADDFVAAWKNIHTETAGESDELKIKEMHLFTHAGPVNLYFFESEICLPEVVDLPKLNWDPMGKIVSHGCNTGLLSKYNLAIGQQFADNQGVPFEGQKGGANFSTREDYRGWSTRVDNSSTDVYLWSFGPDATSKFGRAKNVKVFVPKE